MDQMKFILKWAGLALMFLIAACGGADAPHSPASPAPSPAAAAPVPATATVAVSPSPTTGETHDAATSTPAPTVNAGAAAIAPVSEEQALAELRRAGISPRGWRTNFTLRSVDYGDISGGGPGKDGIPAIDAPRFETVAEADEWLDGREPVQVVNIGGDARAYPMQIMMFHEIVNDTVGGEPVVVTY